MKASTLCLLSQCFLYAVIYSPIIQVECFSGLAGTCIDGAPAVGGAHTSNAMKYDGTLDDIGVDVNIGGITLAPNADSPVLETGKNYAIEVLSSSYPYKGLLVRIQSDDSDVDLSSSIIPAVNTKYAQACVPPIGGIDHTDASDKKSSIAIVRLDQPGDVNFDVTVVFFNNMTASVFGYNRFQIKFEGDVFIRSDSPSTFPSDIPSATPSYTSSSIPSLTPVETPSKRRLLSKSTQDGRLLRSRFEDYLQDVVENPFLKSVSPSPFSTSISPSPSGTSSPSPSYYGTQIPSVLPNFIATTVPNNLPFSLTGDLTTTIPKSSPSPFPFMLSSSELTSASPSFRPSDIPSILPSKSPTLVPSDYPSSIPTSTPSMTPSDIPSSDPSTAPIVVPSDYPSYVPSDTPSTEPSSTPLFVASNFVSDTPSGFPSDAPSGVPSTMPLFVARNYEMTSDTPSAFPSDAPSVVPSNIPLVVTSDYPSLYPREWVAPKELLNDATKQQSSDSSSDVPSTTPSNTPSYAPASTPASTSDGRMDIRTRRRESTTISRIATIADFKKFIASDTTINEDELVHPIKRRRLQSDQTHLNANDNELKQKDNSIAASPRELSMDITHYAKWVLDKLLNRIDDTFSVANADLASDIPSTLPSDIPSSVPSYIPSITPIKWESFQAQNGLATKKKQSMKKGKKKVKRRLEKQARSSQAPSSMISDAPSTAPSIVPTPSLDDATSFTNRCDPATSFSVAKNPDMLIGNKDVTLGDDIPSQTPSDTPSNDPTQSFFLTPKTEIEAEPIPNPLEIKAIMADLFLGIGTRRELEEVESNGQRLRYVGTNSRTTGADVQQSTDPIQHTSSHYRELSEGIMHYANWFMNMILNRRDDTEASVMETGLSSDVPSAVPSDVPSAVPSDVPSSVPSSFPSPVDVSTLTSDYPSSDSVDTQKLSSVTIRGITSEERMEVKHAMSDLFGESRHLEEFINRRFEAAADSGTSSLGNKNANDVQETSNKQLTHDRRRDLYQIYGIKSVITLVNDSAVIDITNSSVVTPTIQSVFNIDSPSSIPSDAPSIVPSDVPSMVPSDVPSIVPSDVPSIAPSDIPSMQTTAIENLEGDVTATSSIVDRLSDTVRKEVTNLMKYIFDGNHRILHGEDVGTSQATEANKIDFDKKKDSGRVLIQSVFEAMNGTTNIDTYGPTTTPIESSDVPSSIPTSIPSDAPSLAPVNIVPIGESDAPSLSPSANSLSENNEVPGNTTEFLQTLLEQLNENDVPEDLESLKDKLQTVADLFGNNDF